MLITVIGIVIAARIFSFPAAAVWPMAGNVLFFALLFIGVWHIISALAALLTLAGLILFLCALGSLPHES